MKSIYKIFVLLLIVLSFNGCVSRFFSVGEERSYCDENGCNYKDSGVLSMYWSLMNSWNFLKSSIPG